MSPRLILVAGVLALAAMPALAAPTDAMKVTGPWMRPVAAGQTDAGYMTLTNTGKQPDRLVGAVSPGAGKVVVMLSVMEGEVSTMKTLPPSGLELAPGQTIRFEPGGYHLMIEDLKSEEKLGSALPLVLTFAHAGKVKVSFKVAAGPPG